MSATAKTPGALGPAPSTAADRLPVAPPAYAYLMRCADGTLYAGWTNDLARRTRAHKTGTGAKYTKARHGAALAYAEQCADKSAALKREAALKKLSKPQKEALAADWAAQTRVTVRPATLDDAAAVLEIYRWYVTHSTATFQYDQPTEADYRAMIAHTVEKCPFLVAQRADGNLAGYACAHPWHERQAFSWDVETTIYCAPEGIGHGVGGRLYAALLALLKAQGYHTAYALIAHPNPSSEAFHKAFGFARYGLEPATGYKFGQWLGLGYWRLALLPAEGEPAPVRYQLPETEQAAILAEANR